MKEIQPGPVLQEIIQEIYVVLLRPEGVHGFFKGGDPLQLESAMLCLGEHGPCHFEITLVIVNQKDFD
jgi:hypothetical protein